MDNKRGNGHSLNINGKSVMVFASYGKMVRDLAARWLRLAKERIREKGSFTAALSGGETPAGFYRELAMAGKGNPVWGQTHIFQVDERHVPADNPESNMGMIRRLLLDHVPALSGNIHAVNTSLSLEESALDYERQIRNVMEEGGFDLVLLGMGQDGHTASIFPGKDNPVFKEAGMLVAPVSSKQKNDRVTLTLAAINRARQVIFLVSGGKKAEVLYEVLSAPPEAALPASLVKPETGELVFYADKDAASVIEAKVSILPR
ncbi:MAG: 6-phosphogluconolactonase [Actinomycetota bacterium]|nr:6-phosphogluconolactonase [Actinomycetota bacterium]